VHLAVAPPRLRVRSSFHVWPPRTSSLRVCSPVVSQGIRAFVPGSEKCSIHCKNYLMYVCMGPDDRHCLHKERISECGSRRSPCLVNLLPCGLSEFLTYIEFNPGQSTPIQTDFDITGLTCAVELVSRGRGFLDLVSLTALLLPLFYFTWTAFSFFRGNCKYERTLTPATPLFYFTWTVFSVLQGDLC
jgi:hypothetical protein